MLTLVSGLYNQTGTVGDRGAVAPDPPCPAPAGTKFPSQNAAALGAARSARADQRADGDNNERFFFGWPLAGGGWTFGSIGMGTEETWGGAMPVRARIMGHTHTGTGGDELSRSMDLGLLDRSYRGDMERTQSAMDQLEAMGIDTSDFMTFLVGQSGVVKAWYGRNLYQRARILGTDQCPSR